MPTVATRPCRALLQRLLLLLATLLPAMASGDFTVASPCVQLGAAPSVTERFAGEEVARYLGVMLSRAIPVRQTPEQGEYPIRIGGACPGELTAGFSRKLAHAEHDAFVIRQQPDGTDLAGNSDRGTLYACYEFLEKLGCRWFFPGELGECIPRLASLELPVLLEKQIPSFHQRTIDVGETDNMDFAEIIDWAAKNRLNFIPASRMPFVRRLLPPEKQDIWDKRGGQQEWQFHVHNLPQMVRPEVYFAEHPEYFALYKGKRHPTGTPGHATFGGGNLCTTNPDVIRLCTQFVINYFDRTPEGIVVPLWPADGSVIWCECPECKKLRGINFMGGRRGSMTRRMLTFGNAIAKRVAEKYPDRLILVPAYANYIQPVPDFPLEPNVYIQYCIHGDYAHGVDKCDHNLQERTTLEEWAKITKGGPLGVWEYFLLGDHYAQPRENSAMLPCLYRVRDTLPYFRRIGVNNYMTQASTKYWKHNMAVYYFTARYAWNVQQDFPALLQDFCQKMFGPAGTFICRYYTLIEDAVAAADWHPTVYSDLAVPSPSVFTPAVLSQTAALLQQAEKCNLSPLQRKRLELVLETYRNIRDNVGIQASLGLSSSVQWSVQKGARSYVMNPAGREISQTEVERLILNAQDAGGYDEEFRRILFRARKRVMPLLFLQNDKLTAAILPELGGRLLRLARGADGRNIFSEPATVQSSIGEKYVSYGGYEEFLGKGFAAPGWECPYSVQKQSEDSVTLRWTNDGVQLDRSYTLRDSTLEIRTVITNLTQVPFTTQLRTHPFFQCEGGVAAIQLALQQGQHARASTIAMENDRRTKNFSGGNCRLDGPDLHLQYRVDSSANGDLYFCKMNDKIFTMEWMGQETQLPPNGSLTLHQFFTILPDTGK